MGVAVSGSSVAGEAAGVRVARGLLATIGEAVFVGSIVAFAVAADDGVAVAVGDTGEDSSVSAMCAGAWRWSMTTVVFVGVPRVNGAH